MSCCRAAAAALLPPCSDPSARRLLRRIPSAAALGYDVHVTLLRQCVESVSAYVPGEQPKDPARVVKLNTNENPYPPSPRCVEAIAQELAGQGEKLRFYSDPMAVGLREAAAALTGLSLSQVLHGNGSDELLAMLLRACVDPGDRVAYPSPTYTLYETLALTAGAVVEPHPFAPGFELPESLFHSNAKLIIVASPGAPAGNSQPTAVLEKLARSCPRSVVVVDEAYADFADQNALSLVGRLPNLVVLRTFSKSYSLAGMRLGLLYGPEALVQGIGKVKDSYNLDRLAIVAGRAALQDQDWMRANTERVRRSRTALRAAFMALGLDPLPSDANFIFVRCGSAARAAALFQGLKARGVLVRYFPLPGLADGLRISVGDDAQNARLLEELKHCLAHAAA